MKKKYVLQVGGGALIKRGVEKYLQNINSELNHERIQMDVLTPDICQNDELKKEIEDKGGKVIELKCKRNKLLRYLDFCTKLNRYLKDNEYDVVEAQTGSMPIMALSVFIADRRHIRTKIVHTQNTHERNWKYKVQYTLFGNLMTKADYFFACSMKAGMDSFPKRVHSRIKVIPNGIDVAAYQFNEVRRQGMRKKLNIKNELVIGHIGAFTKQKNHDFLINVFACVCKYRKNAILLLVGEGELQEEIKEKVKQYQLVNQVIFYGVSNEVSDLLSCMDVFVFPSTWEGLGIAVVEAQANGLPCIYSDKLPEEVHINDNCCCMSIDDSPEAWASKILEIKSSYEERKAYNNIVCQSQFSSKKVADDLEKIYLRE